MQGQEAAQTFLWPRGAGWSRCRRVIAFIRQIFDHGGAAVSDGGYIRARESIQ
jgi:hypothetical protein